MQNGRGLRQSGGQWYKEAIIYQLHVRAFADSNGDGIGDLRGLIGKLDYLADVGITALWLLPFYPSPLKDDGYDISNYMDVHESYGTVRDFREFLREAHRRGIRVITELVINHTSDQHEWFQKSRRAAAGSYWRNFYVWSDTPEKYREARIIFKDFETSNWAWDPIAQAYYWHRFYAHQPDLNFDNPEVQKAIIRVMDFWLDMGVDGMRLDAVPYLFEREGTSCENLPETHAFIRFLRKHVDEKYPGRMLLAEANQWPEDAAAYFGQGDESHMCFHFPLMPRLFMALRMEDRYSIVDILRQTPQIPDNCQWAIFLRNHDELTLEMVTDEERDYMQRVYATDPRARINLGIRRRLAPLVGNDRHQIELLNGLLFSLPGTPILYYGDEIGMGDNIYLGDRNGVRTPFQWSPDRNAGFSRANPQRLYLPLIVSPEYHYEALNVETQQANPNSLLWWTKKLIAIRKMYPEFASGELEFLNTENPKVLAYTRGSHERTLLVVANLSRKVQPVELDLSRFRGRLPRELFGHVDFPVISDQPYFLTLGPHDFYWFELVEKASIEAGQWLIRNPSALPMNMQPLRALSEESVWRNIEPGIRSYLYKTKWFTGKNRRIESVVLEDTIVVRQYRSDNEAVLGVVRVNYRNGETDTYFLMLGYAEGERMGRIRDERPDLVIGPYVRTEGEERKEGIYFDAIVEAGLSQALLDAAFRRRILGGRVGELRPELFVPAKKEWLHSVPAPSLAELGDNNSAVTFGQQFHVKYYRRIEEGENPEIEIALVLNRAHAAAKAPYSLARVPNVLGAFTYVNGDKRYSVGLIEQYVEHEMSAWLLVLDHLSRAAERFLAKDLDFGIAMKSDVDIWRLRDESAPERLLETSGMLLGLAELLGQRVAELHLALATAAIGQNFVAEPFTPFYQRALFQSFRNLVERAMYQISVSMQGLSPKGKEFADRIRAADSAIVRRMMFVKEKPLEVSRIRTHGDLNLTQVLFTGNDFVIVDFEGEPDRSLGERRLKKAALRDVAGLVRSIDLATIYFLNERGVRTEDRERTKPALAAWSKWVSSRLLNGYFKLAIDPRLTPRSREVARALIDAFILERSLSELRYELGANTPWLDVILEGLSDRVAEFAQSGTQAQDADYVQAKLLEDKLGPHPQV